MPRPLKILFLATDAFGGYGGIAQYNRDVLTAMSHAKSIGEVEVLVRLSPDLIGSLPAKIRQYPAIPGRLSYALKAITRALAFRPDIVFNGHLYHGSLAYLAAKLVGAKMISQLHGTEVWEQLAPMQLSPLERSDLVLCVSRHTKACYDRQSLRDQANSIVVPNTVGAEFELGDRDAARKKFNLEGEKAILTVARLDSRGGYKGHDRIIRYLRTLTHSNDAVRYLIAGDGPDLPRLEQLSRDCGVADKVRFLGKVPIEDLPDLYRAADLFALPSTGEGFGIVFLEAMSCGTPAIGLNVGGSCDALADGDLGVCVNETDFPAALEAALRMPRPAPEALSDAVTERFGRKVFNLHIESALAQLI
jgi:phosphatidylinositol alpha-1,6-mannosyltransferase